MIKLSVFNDKDTLMIAKYKVTLNTEEQAEIEKIISHGKHASRTIKRAKILLMSHKMSYSIQEMMELIPASLSTIYRTRRNFVEYGLEQALYEDARSGQPAKLDANQEALLIAIACSAPPQGRCRWTLTLLGNQLITLTELESISPETIRQRLKENELKPWQKKNVVHR